jgi:hypothetical protein
MPKTTSADGTTTTVAHYERRGRGESGDTAPFFPAIEAIGHTAAYDAPAALARELGRFFA